VDRQQPVALYSLDCPSMLPIADEHGTVTSYVQVTELGQRADVRAARGHPHLPRLAAQLSVRRVTDAGGTATDHGMAVRRGHVEGDLPQGLPACHPCRPPGVSVIRARSTAGTRSTMQRNVGPRNIGNPINTKGGAGVNELAQSRTMDYLKFLDQKRDEIIACVRRAPGQGWRHRVREPGRRHG
jgi:hypothetical protein